jgi:hypothetical protein
MKTGTQVALAVGAGYILGRRHKMRLAMMLGGAAVAGGVGGIGGQLVRRGAKFIGSADLLGKVSPELREIGGVIRHDLLDAGKGAARTAVNSRIDSLSDRLRDQADAWRSPAEAARGITGGGRHEQDEPEEDETEEDETEEAEDGARQRASGDRGARRRVSVRRDDEGAEERPARRARSSARSAGSASPVRRTRR